MDTNQEWHTDASGRKYRLKEERIGRRVYMVREYEKLYSRTDGRFTETQVKELKESEKKEG